MAAELADHRFEGNLTSSDPLGCRVFETSNTLKKLSPLKIWGAESLWCSQSIYVASFPV